MRPLETAYRLGALQAGRDFETQLKEAALGIPPGAPHPGSPSAVPKPSTPNPAESIKLPNPAAQAQKQIAGLGNTTGNAPPMPGTNQTSAFGGGSGGSRQGAPG